MSGLDEEKGGDPALDDSLERTSPAQSPGEDTASSDVGTGGLRQSSRVLNSISSGPYAGRKSWDMEEELVAVPDSDASPAAEGTDDPATRIAEFKQKREKHERWGLAAILNVLLLLNIGSMVISQWMLRDHNPQTNPFREDVNGTSHFTESGLQWYSDTWAVLRWAQAGVVALPLPLEEIAAEFKWSTIIQGKAPPITSMGLWLSFTVPYLSSIYSLSVKYGWPAVAAPLIMWLRYLVFGRFQFVKVPNVSRSLLFREQTLFEHVILMRLCWSMMYPTFDLMCIREGQWDGKTVGRAGGTAMVLLQYAYVVFAWSKWGKHVFNADPQNSKDRGTVFVEAWCMIVLSYQVGQLLHSAFLMPDLPDNAGLATVSGVALPHSYWWHACWTQGMPPLVFLCFRDQIFSVLKAPLRKKQRLHDGAFIAALLADDDSESIMNEATSLFRGVPFSSITADLLRSSKGTQADYALSQPCKLNQVDFFVSHSWSDDADQKYANLAVAAADFQCKHGREPIIWLCNRLMILAGNTYCDRLWCVWELYVFFSTSGVSATKRVELHDFSDTGTSSLLEFNVEDAHCFSPTDEAKLRSIIESGGSSLFNAMIQEVGHELQSAAASST